MDLLDELKQSEGLRLVAYQDHLGVWTIGYGTNLQTLEISQELAAKWLLDKVNYLKEKALSNPTYRKLDSVRQDVIICMMYQMGYAGTMAFKNMWAALDRGDYKQAGAEMRDSAWWRDPLTRNRAERMAVIMETE